MELDFSFILNANTIIDTNMIDYDRLSDHYDNQS